MKVLVSPVSPQEAILAADGGADIIDVKNTSEGSLGANFPWIIREVVSSLQERPITFSATLGDLTYKPGTAALAATGAAYAGARYIKAGMYGTKTLEEASHVMSAVARACRDFDENIVVVTAGYADYRRFGGLDPQILVEVAVNSKSDVVMVDTAIKDGATLFDNLELADIRSFIESAHGHGLKVALAGSIKQEHVPLLLELQADIVGVRGAVCQSNDRDSHIITEKVQTFVSAIKSNAA